MKIMYIYDSLAKFGGEERILIDKMNWLANNSKNHIYLITTSQGNHPFIFTLSPNVKHIDIDIREHSQYKFKYPKRLFVKWVKLIQFKRYLQKQIYAINPDVIIGTTHYRADVICNLKCNSKIIIESHCNKNFSSKNDGIYRNPFLQVLNYLYISYYNKTIENKCDVLVTLTKGDAKNWNASRICIIPNIITRIPVTQSKCNNKRVISVGRLTHQKGFDNLINVWKIVSQKHPDWILDIYGDGELWEQLNEQITNATLNNTIVIHPSTHDIFEKMKESSIKVLTSRYEGFGLVLIESMINGVPCISFDCPYGPSDIIQDGENGYLVENGNIQELADRICYLIENEEVRKTMGQKARLSAMRYAPENIMPVWIKLFNDIIKS